MEQSIKVGDTVRLKSGGPMMTVATIDTLSSTGVLNAWCDWFDKEKKIEGVFPVTSLRADEYEY